MRLALFVAIALALPATSQAADIEEQMAKACIETIEKLEAEIPKAKQLLEDGRVGRGKEFRSHGQRKEFAEMIEAQEKQIAEWKAGKLTFSEDDYIVSPYRVGDFGKLFGTIKVEEVIDHTTLHVTPNLVERTGSGQRTKYVPVGKDKKRIRIEGIDASRVTTDSMITLDVPVFIYRTYTYTTVIGGSNTILAAAAVNNVERTRQVVGAMVKDHYEKSR